MTRQVIAPTTLPDVIRWLIPIFCEQHGLCGAESINEGYCELFATTAAYYVDDAVPLWDSETDNPRGYSCHCFIEYCGRFYDSEAPDGVDDWMELPIYARMW